MIGHTGVAEAYAAHLAAQLPAITAAMEAPTPQLVIVDGVPHAFQAGQLPAVEVIPQSTLTGFKLLNINGSKHTYGSRYQIRIEVTVNGSDWRDAAARRLALLKAVRYALLETQEINLTDPEEADIYTDAISMREAIGPVDGKGHMQASATLTFAADVVETLEPLQPVDSYYPITLVLAIHQLPYEATSDGS